MNRAPNEPTRLIYARESIFWGKNGCFRAKHPYYFGREHISENHLGTSFALFFWSGMATNGSERPISDPKWPRMHIFGQIWPFLGLNLNFLEREQKLWYSHSRTLTRHLVPNVFWSGIAPKWTRNANISTKMEKISFVTKILIFKGGSKIFGTLISANILDTCFMLKVLTGDAPMGR